MADDASSVVGDTLTVGRDALRLVVGGGDGGDGRSGVGSEVGRAIAGGMGVA